MSIEGIDRKQLEELAEAGASITIPASLLLALIVRIEKLEEEVARLKSNSRTSSKPPSSDHHNPNKPPKKPREKGGKKRKPGGQKGHEGSTLKQVAHPDKVIGHSLGEKCSHCRGSLRGAKGRGYEKRQVFDLPEKISLEVTEHRAEKAICPCCGKKLKASFPPELKAPAQYGQRLRAVVLYLQAYQLIPCERLGQLVGDLFGHPLSPGAVCAMLQSGGARAGPVHEQIKEAIAKGDFLHSDETGLSVSGKLHWLHTASNSKLTFLHVDEKRGEAALRTMGVLEGYHGYCIHDFLSAYYKIEDLKHGLCNAHHLRDLTCVHEDYGQRWAADMISLLMEAKKLKEREMAGGRPLGPKTLERLQNTYFQILEEGYALNPEPERRPGQRGRLKRGKPLNLLDRFRDHHEEVMGFVIYDLPFDNNQAERDLRMMKTKQKISGCFRNLSQARAFAKVRSVIASAKKQSLNVLDILKTTLSNPHQVAKILVAT